jgi:glycosyltransferase involved in cell wall biosynthesis
VADALWVQQYLRDTYQADSRYIAYGADRFGTPDPNRLDELGATPYGYDLVIGRIEPENNIELILQGVTASKNPRQLLIFANKSTEFAQHLMGLYHDPRIRFMGGLFDQELLNHLRYHSNLYFHGHSVGGTNPSLIEALAGGALVCAHQNPFNSAIVGNDGYYFTTAAEITAIRDSVDKLRDAGDKLANNWRKIETEFTTDRINDQYEQYLLECLARDRRRK